MLERAVVELHHVQPGAPLGVEPACEVGVDDVESSRAEREVERLDVDDHLVADAHLADHRLVGPGAALGAVDADGERIGRDDRPPAQLQHARPPRSRPRARRASRVRASALTDLLRGVVRLGPVGEQHALVAPRDQRVRVAAATRRHVARARPRRASARGSPLPRAPTRDRSGSRGTSRSPRGRRRSRARRPPRCRRRPSRRPPLPPGARRCFGPLRGRGSGPRRRSTPSRPRSPRRSPWSHRRGGRATCRKSPRRPRRWRCGRPRG